jgi:hypothetical protein
MVAVLAPLLAIAFFYRKNLLPLPYPYAMFLLLLPVVFLSIGLYTGIKTPADVYHQCYAKYALVSCLASSPIVRLFCVL